MNASNEFFRAFRCAVIGILALPVLGQAQSGPDIMRNAIGAQAERLAGIENVTITQEVMGMETALYMEKRDLEGTPVLVPVSVSMGGMTNPVPEEMSQADWASPFQEAWIERARLVGEETLAGRPVYVLAVEDFSGLEMPGMPAGTQGSPDVQPKSVQFWMDTDDYLVRRVSMDMESTAPDGTMTPVHMDMFMEDYREVDGYMHPFLTRTLTEGVMEAVDMDPEEVRAQLAQLRGQIENVPEAQRAMVEGMLNAQIERLESMLEGEGGMEMTITVKDIQVNRGRPGGE